MADPERRHRDISRSKRIRAALAGLILLVAVPLYAATPVAIVVTGIDGRPLKNVRAALVLPSGLDEGEVDRLWLDRFAEQARAKVQSALEPFGYYNAQLTIAADVDAHRLLVQVVPGDPVRLSAVTVTLSGAGRVEPSLRRLIADFPLQPGEVLLQPEYEAAKSALKARALELGYLDAEYSRHEIRIANGAATAVIDLALATGELHVFGATRIAGAPDYPESFLRRHLTYHSGERFSYPPLGETQLNFTNSERFKTVTITPDQAIAGQVPINVQLTPAPRITLRPGIGYGTDTGARFSVRYRDLNMFHQGHELYSQLYYAERLQGLVTGYILPSATDTRSSTTLQLNLQQEETTTYASRIMVLELDRNRSFGPGKLGTLYVKAQYEDYTLGLQESTAQLLLPGVRFSDNRYDNLVRPSHGWRYALDLRGTDQRLGSDTALFQVLAEGSHLVSFPWRLSLHTRAAAATTLLNDPLCDIPPSLRFFAGGDQSVRGYTYKSLGPRDASGNVTGGKQLLVGSIELERALFADWGVSLFYDTGNAFNSFSAIGLYQGAGVGLHYFTPVGALNLFVARPLGIDHPSFHIHFTVGFEL